MKFRSLLYVILVIPLFYSCQEEEEPRNVRAEQETSSERLNPQQLARDQADLQSEQQTTQNLTERVRHRLTTPSIVDSVEEIGQVAVDSPEDETVSEQYSKSTGENYRSPAIEVDRGESREVIPPIISEVDDKEDSAERVEIEEEEGELAVEVVDQEVETTEDEQIVEDETVEVEVAEVVEIEADRLETSASDVESRDSDIKSQPLHERPRLQFPESILSNEPSRDGLYYSFDHYSLGEEIGPSQQEDTTIVVEEEHSEVLDENEEEVIANQDDELEETDERERSQEEEMDDSLIASIEEDDAISEERNEDPAFSEEEELVIAIDTTLDQVTVIEDQRPASDVAEASEVVESDEGQGVEQEQAAVEEEIGDIQDENIEIGRVFNCRSNLMVRTGPDENRYPFVGRLSCSDSPEVTILSETDNGWYKIDYQGRPAYVHGDYIRLSEETEQLIADLGDLQDFNPQYPHDHCGPLGIECDQDRDVASQAESVDDDPQAQGLNWLDGCETLSRRSQWNSENRSQVESLHRCAQSIRNAITNRGQDMNRERVFRRLYSQLNPIEQHFAAMVFTAVGEAGTLTDSNSLEEMLAVMKVVDNRVDRANQRNRNRNFNQLDIVLDPVQFSMYNANSNNWRSRFNPRNDSIYRGQMNNAIKSYLQYPTASFEPQPQMDHVYHYHTNFVVPSWSRHARGHSEYEITPVINGQRTRPAPRGFDENTRAGRDQIRRRHSRVRHRFFIHIDNRGRGNIQNGWVGRPRTPFR